MFSPVHSDGANPSADRSNNLHTVAVSSGPQRSSRLHAGSARRRGELVSRVGERESELFEHISDARYRDQMMEGLKGHMSFRKASEIADAVLFAL